MAEAAHKLQALSVRRLQCVALLLVSALLGTACGGGGGGGGAGDTQPPKSDDTARSSTTSPFSAGCDGVAASGTLYTNAEVEPSLSVNPLNPTNLVGAWQQDRWSNGGARGVLLGSSSDGGHTWTMSQTAFSRCTGGNAANGGDYTRATDPWVSFSPSGTVYALALAFTGGALAPGSSSAMRVAQSTDGGASWSTPRNVIVDGADSFDDKGSITADPTDAHFIYVVWDRAPSTNHSATFLGRSTDGGATWETPRAMYDPGASNQTLGNIIVVLPGGALINVFTEIDSMDTPTEHSSLRAIRSSDHGMTWSTPVQIADLLSIGVRDPDSGTAVRDASQLASVAADAAGTLYVAWQDARFSSGARDGIALSRSADGGTTWSAPVQINTVATTQAFIPTVNVRADGMIGVTYYDFRNNTSSPQTLLTDYWLVTSSDATNWTESHITGPFDLSIAPRDSGDLFLGDYQSLASSGATFLPFFAKTNDGNAANPTDIFVAFANVAARTAAAPALRTERAAAASGLPSWQPLVQANIDRMRRARLERSSP